MFVIDLGSMIWQEMRDRPWLYGDIEFVWPYESIPDTVDVTPAVLHILTQIRVDEEFEKLRLIHN